MLNCCKITLGLLLLTSVAFAAAPLGRVQSDELIEISGLAVSPADPNRLWVHNDSGDTARFFAIDPTGQTLGVWSLAGTEAFDWEDMAAGPGPIPNQPYLYIGDIGDNQKIRPYITVYRVPAPTANSNSEITGFETLTFRYPAGPSDAEALMVDPATKDLLIVSKQKPTCVVYIARYPHQPHQFNLLESIAFVPIPSVTAGDISPDGRRLLLRNTDKAFLWTKQINESWKSALAATPRVLPLAAEPQGESIAWAPDSVSFYTVSEGKNPLLYHYTINYGTPD